MTITSAARTSLGDVEARAKLMPLNRLRMPINAVVVAMIAAVAGCSEPAGPRTVHNRDLAIKVPAIKQAVAHKDLSAAPQLVKDLDNDDPAVRFYAIEGLKRLTGQTLGYVYYDDADRRRAAVMRWRRWLDESQREAGK